MGKTLLRLKPKDLENKSSFIGDGDGDGDGAGYGDGDGDGDGEQLTIISGIHIYEDPVLDSVLSCQLMELPLLVNHPKREIKEIAIRRLEETYEIH